ncbi:spore coat protein U domain-containing protein [Deinococcus yavapaiensis]|uniref:Spore coat protein U-like protein n=1 Tax=Deinococcus yavapaiensis KR-236 TaxID=694435 RepID=A0A318SKB4_9DEIO|nr:spore coat protein U domain-containing protein [Deinococcus yavapaiensis]PYE52998.1 spore coat protein U-like protein [Deinococcus yavapaiensis KR-236]
MRLPFARRISPLLTALALSSTSAADVNVGGSSGPGGSAPLDVQVSVTITSACTLTTSNANFGTYAAADTTAKTAEATITVTCVSGTSYTYRFDAAATPGPEGDLAMIHENGVNTGYLNYEMTGYTFEDNGQAYSVNPYEEVTVTSNGQPFVQRRTFSIYTGQYNAPVGPYKDTHVVSITLLN